MSEKNKKSNGEQHKEEDGSESKKKESGGNATVVLKIDLHCQGCTSKILKCIHTFEGVETADIGNGQITVVGKMDPAKLRERVEKKTLKKVEVVMPTKKGDDKDKDKAKAKNVEKKKEDNAEKKKDPPQEKNTANKSDEKKSKDKEPSVTTAQLKVHLHCEGCIQKIQKIIVKTKGYKDMKIDKQKEIVTVTGVVDMKALAEALKKNLKRDVQLVPAKKEAVKKENPGGEKTNKGKSGGGDGGGNNKMQVQVLNQYPYPYTYPIVYESGQFNYSPYAYGPSHAPQLFSDENPNACSLM
ncbi:heavy metal-associated isoprenylated plant protein 3-like [Salvia hispanica]|uniref:heavy metal-associated isoprenylated plant protein 3-like n=1 Tax=Salvia hispanica TaxID=49212 RepID=UPI0020092A58|nr:heavy metal-associated isoprenylated plant protein 3-like [Salvia hispanica]